MAKSGHYEMPHLSRSEYAHTWHVKLRNSYGNWSVNRIGCLRFAIRSMSTTLSGSNIVIANSP